MGGGNLRVTVEITHLPVLHELTRAACEPLDDAVLEFAQLGEVDLRLAEIDPPRLRVTRLVQELRHVQQRLGRNTAAIHADAARIHFGVDECRGETEIRGKKGGGITTRSAPDDDNLNSSHNRSGKSRGPTRPTRPIIR